MDYKLFYNTTENPFQSTATSELDFVQHWVEQTVEREIIRGQQLQQLKERRPVVQEYDVVNVDDVKIPFCEPSGSQSTKKTTRKKKPKRRIDKSKKGKKEGPVCICCSPKSSRDRKRKVKPKQKCPMRIAELAVPSKRQCLQNWINNKHILPEIMIYRLQQIIRDQRPVVKISDAITCFRLHRSKRKRKSKECEKKAKKCFAKNLKKAKNLSDARVMCGVFAHKIGRILNKPMIIELSSELERIADVVTMDIADLLCKKQPPFRNIYKKKSMLDETAGKIAIWIWSIIEDANYLILEEQLKELEEEIGPVLDIIDDLVDNVVDICYVEPIVDNISSKFSTNVQGEEVPEESKGKLDRKPSYTDLDGSNVDIYRHITKEIYGIINHIDEDSDDFISNISYDEKLRDNLGGKRSQRSLDDKEFVDADDHNEDNFPTDPNEQVDNPEDLDHNVDLEERDEEGKQVSDDFNDGKKHITFSQFNTVKGTNLKEIKSSDEDINRILNWKVSITQIIFAEPNDHLLSDADELWPKDIKYEEMVKNTITLNKSISSMGRIFETEERDSMAPTEDINDYHVNEHLHEQEINEVKIIDKEATESKAVQTSTDITNYDNYKKIRETGINTSPSSSTTSKRNRKKTVTSLSLSDFSKKPSVQVKPRLNYKVSPCTAPAWAMQGFYESSEGSNIRRQINQCQIRKWCSNLQTGYYNLKLWSNWLDETCKMVKKLEQNKAKYCPNKRKYATKWMKLKKEIDDDSSIWNKKHRCTRKQLAEYKDLFRHNLVPKVNCKCSKKIR